MIKRPHINIYRQTLRDSTALSDPISTPFPWHDEDSARGTRPILPSVPSHPGALNPNFLTRPSYAHTASLQPIHVSRPECDLNIIFCSDLRITGSTPSSLPRPLLSQRSEE